MFTVILYYTVIIKNEKHAFTDISVCTRTLFNGNTRNVAVSGLLNNIQMRYKRIYLMHSVERRRLRSRHNYSCCFILLTATHTLFPTEHVWNHQNIHVRGDNPRNSLARN